MNTAVVPEDREQITVTIDELQAEFAQVMREWGHCRTAAGLRFPSTEEARRAGSGRRADRGRSRRPDGTWPPLP